jgi:hypothetical protein
LTYAGRELDCHTAVLALGCIQGRAEGERGEEGCDEDGEAHLEVGGEIDLFRGRVGL